MKKVVWIAIAAVLASCAANPAQQAAVADQQRRFEESKPRCFDSASCERLWSAARNWVINNCAMKIQNITDGYIETFNSTNGNTGLHCRVTKDPLPNDGYALSITTGCANLFGCLPDAWQAAFSFNHAVQSAAPLGAKQGASSHAALLGFQPATDRDRAEAEIAYLEGNASRQNISTTPSGLQYEVVSLGDGPKPTASSTVLVHYTGRLVDGTKFDSSHDRGQPNEFMLKDVTPGFQEGLLLMSEGGTYKLYIPSALAYGAAGTTSGPIGPYATLVFDVELIKVVR